MFLIVQPTPPGDLARGDEEVTQTHAVSSKASLQPTHVPVKSRGSPVGHRGDTRGHEGGSTSRLRDLPPPPTTLPTTQGAGKAGPGQSPGSLSQQSL